MSDIDLGIPGLADIETIGRGGSAAVYKARQISLDRIVAVKVLMSAWDEEVRRRFDRECRSMGKLSDDMGVVPIYESGETSTGAPYIVMPYYNTGSLQDELHHNGPIEWRRAAELIEIVAETVAAAHDAGVIHRDIKPANLLLSNDGQPLISDFGIARHVTDEQLSSNHSTPLFTPAYCSPESFSANEATRTLDVYALGTTFWALLAGHAPFKSKNEKVDMLTVFARVANDPIGDLRPTVPEPICRLVERTTAKKPEDRPQTAHMFVAELRAAIEKAGPDLHSFAVSEPITQSSVVDPVETIMLSRATDDDGPSQFEYSSTARAQTPPQRPGIQSPPVPAPIPPAPTKTQSAPRKPPHPEDAVTPLPPRVSGPPATRSRYFLPILTAVLAALVVLLLLTLVLAGGDSGGGLSVR